jgi:hypothetical protein
MRLALSMSKVATGGFSCASIEEIQLLIMKPHAEVHEEKMRRVQFPWHNHVTATME